MAPTSLLSLSLAFLVLFHGFCFAQIEQVVQEQQQQQQTMWQSTAGNQQHRQRTRTDCNIQRINALEPNRRVESEAGLTEIWEPNNYDELECAGVATIRHVLQPRSLLLPSYANAPQLIYVIQGRGLQGTAIPGCPETYETGSGGQQQEGRGDRHQKVRQIRQGDIIAVPAGIAHWAFNNGDEPLVCVALLDVGNDANQLDLNWRKFFLAGNPQHQEQGRREREREERRRRERGGRNYQRGEQQQQNAGNVFNGFDEQTLAEIFNVDTETARRLQGQDDNRGNIVRVEKEFQVISPQYQEEEERERERGSERERRLNGVEETVCTMRLRQNIANPSAADVYNPRGGRVRSINGQDLPVLNAIQLSAERVVLYKNAILAPRWNINAHSIVYITRGSGRFQIVGNNGRAVCDDQVREGQIVVVPQNHAVLAKAGNEGVEWISFKTNGNAMSSQLAGRVSAIRSMPEDVLVNSYDISREDARRLKYNREEMTIFSPGV